VHTVHVHICHVKLGRFLHLYCSCFSGIVALLLVYVIIIREIFNVHQLDIHHRVAQRVLHMEQELLTLPQQLNSVGFALLHI